MVVMAKYAGAGKGVVDSGNITVQLYAARLSASVAACRPCSLYCRPCAGVSTLVYWIPAKRLDMRLPSATASTSPHQDTPSHAALATTCPTELLHSLQDDVEHYDLRTIFT